MAYNQQTIRRSVTPGWRTAKLVAHVVSFVFHPLFIPTFVIGFLLYIHPVAYAGFDRQQKFFRLLSVFFSTCFLPAFSVFLCRQLGFVQSIFLRTSRERIIPYAIVMIFYFWIWYVFKNQTDNPPAAVRFLLGCFLSVCGGWLANIYFRVSMHAVAAGGLWMFAVLFNLAEPFASGLYLALAVLVAGAVCTARFLVSDHSAKDVYLGFGLGLIAQLFAWEFFG